MNSAADGADSEVFARYRGTVTVRCEDGTHVWRFRWDCRWRAEQEQMHDSWGMPDQSRAAREFGWRCFARWEPMTGTAPSAGSPFEQGA